MKINLNADIGEGFGAYDIGNDTDLMTVIKSASVACGFHAGDANTMHKLVTLAKAGDVSLGVHPGFNDLWGFGRRRIEMKPKDLGLMVAYQIGALQAMARYAGLPVTHLKPHGALNNMAAEREDYALAIGRAIQTVDPKIVYVALYGSEMEKAGRKLGLDRMKAIQNTFELCFRDHSLKPVIPACVAKRSVSRDPRRNISVGPGSRGKPLVRDDTPKHSYFAGSSAGVPLRAASISAAFFSHSCTT